MNGGRRRAPSRRESQRSLAAPGGSWSRRRQLAGRLGLWLAIAGLIASIAVIAVQVADPETLDLGASDDVALPAPGTTPSSSPSIAPTPTIPTPQAPPAQAILPGTQFVAHPRVGALDQRLAAEGLVRVKPEDLVPLSFDVASFNILGASHTRGAKRRPGYADASRRLPPALGMLDAKQVTVAGLQEIQSPQVDQLRRLRGEGMGIYPGVSLGARLADNSIVWRTDTWELLEQQTTPVPYFRGNMTPMPQVLLRHRETGRQVWFGNFHNPANVAGDARRWREEALRIEADLALTLGADGTPVIITGDMNDRAEFACPFSARSGMHSPDGARTENGQCLTPKRMSVDWIFGDRQIQFSNYGQDWSSKDRKLSDHPLISARAELLGAAERPECSRHQSRRGPVWYCPTPGAEQDAQQ